MYGYEEDSVPSRSLVFGLNAAAARITKFEWINNGGAGGSEGEALDIQLTIEGSDQPKSYRLFPFTKAYDKGVEITDPKHPAFIKALKDFNAAVTHIMHCYVSKENLQVALGRPIATFKEFCKILMSLMPIGYDMIMLDLFAQYQWQLKGDAKQTYLEIPKNMKQGRWLCPAVTPVGNWKEMITSDFTDKTPIALKYVDQAGNIHPFVRSGWFMCQPWANQIKEDSAQDQTDIPEGDSAGGFSQDAADANKVFAESTGTVPAPEWGTE